MDAGDREDTVHVNRTSSNVRQRLSLEEEAAVVSAGAMDSHGIRVLHVVPSLEIGGLEHVVLDLVALGAEAGQEVHVLCIDCLGELAPLVANAGGNVYCLQKPPGFSFTELEGIAEYLRAVRPDVMHTHAPGPLYYAGPPARRVGIKAILHTEHGSLYGGGWRKRLIGRLASRHAKRFICVSEATADHVLKHRVVPRRKVQVIYNGIDVERFEQARSGRAAFRVEVGIPDAARVIGTVGRLSEVKRQDVLIRALAHMRKSLPECRLLLVGDGPAKRELTQLARDLGLEEHVVFAGYREDRERCLAAMDLFALTSDSEGTPLSLLEAWATGVPTVVTSVGGVPELVEDGVTGLLAPPGDPDRFAAALLSVLSDNGLRQRLRDSAKIAVRSRFDRRVMAAQYTNEYMALIRRQ